MKLTPSDLANAPVAKTARGVKKNFHSEKRGDPYGTFLEQNFKFGSSEI